MAGDQQQQQQQQQQRTDWERLARDAATRIGAVIASIGGLVAFIAAVGGAIVWTRFEAAELPADQALDAMPQGELIATGAITLAAFSVLGVVAAAGVYLIDHGGSKEHRNTRGLSRGLLVLVAVEAVAVSAFAIAETDRGWERWIITVEAAILLLLLSLILTRAPTWWAALRATDARTADAKVSNSEPRAIVAVDGYALTFIVVWSVAALVLALLLSDWMPVAMVALAGLIVVPGTMFGLRWLNDDTQRTSPASLYLRRPGSVAMIALAIAAVIIPSLVMQQWWLAVSLATAGALGSAAWLTATVTDRNFLWYGAVVFASVPLLGAITAIVSNIADPQVQPLALIRAGDDEREALQGIYVTETDDYVYLASVAGDACTGEVEDDSGRMTKVPREDVVAMSLGPRQSVADAGRRALEMYYALAPSAENPPVLTIAGQKAAEAHDQPRRLEDPGPAVRREFGGSLRIDEAAARPGDEVTIRGTGLGDTANGRTLRVNGIPAEISRRTPIDQPAGTTGQDPDFHWNAWAIRFIVPDGATTGPVTIECDPVATQPRLRVQHLPRARVELHLAGSNGRIKLDSRRSGDVGGSIHRRRWTVGQQGAVPGATLVRDFPSRDTPYDLVLEVEDDEGDKDTAAIKLWRLSFEGGATQFLSGYQSTLASIRAELDRRSGAHLVIHAQLGGSANEEQPHPALELARDILVATRGNETQREGKRQLLRAFDQSCPMALQDGQGHVDVFVLDPGTQPVPSADCKVAHVE